MADTKKYYWIKLKTDFFNQETIDFLMAQENGCQYIVLYQMLCLQTANNNGELATRIGEVIVPFDVKKIVRDTKYFDFDTVTVAMELFTKLGLIYYQEENQTLKISNFEEMVGSETEWAEKKRIYRQKQGQIAEKSETLSEDKKRTLSDKRLDIRDKRLDIRDKELEKEREKEEKKSEKKKSASAPAPVRHKYGEYKNVLLTDQELEKLKAELPGFWKPYIESLSAYMKSTGKSYKDHLATIRNWARRDAEKAQQEKKTKTPGNKAAEELSDSYEMMARWAEEGEN